jgi:hypothetical protein
VSAQPPGPGRAPSPPPRVVTVLGVYTLLGLTCLPALPVSIATAALLRVRPKVRPGLVAAIAAVALAGVLAAARTPVFGGNLLTFHLSGWALFSIARPRLDLALWRMVFEAPIGIPLGVLLGALQMAHGDRTARTLPWHPRTVARATVADARTRQQASRALERAPAFVAGVPPLGVALDGDLTSWRVGAYAILPPELRARAITLAGAPGVGKTVLLRRLVAADGACGRRAVFIDCKATEPRLPAELVAAYMAGARLTTDAGFTPRVKLWPAEPLSGWEGDATDLANRLLAVQEWSEVWYHRVTSRVIRLACGADIGPPRSAEELLERLTAEALERLYAGSGRAGLVKQVIGAEGFEGAALRYGDFFDALAGKFDGSWSYDDADIAVLSLPVLADREDADAAFRLLLEDLAHYGIRRKDRDDHGMTVYLDDFSAVSNGARAAIDLAERLRDAGVGVVFVVQSYEGLGDEHQAARLLGSSAAVIVHRMPHPDRLLAAAGQVWTPEQTWQLDQYGPAGYASLRMQQRPRIDPDAVRRAEVGEAWVIAAGHSLHLHVLQTLYTAPEPAGLPAPDRDGQVAAEQERAPWVVDLPEPEGSGEPQRGAPVGELPPSRPALPPPAPELPRLRLQLAAAVREGDDHAVRAVLERAARVAPNWDAQAELAELQAVRRQRRRTRRPAWLAWLTRIVHPGRTRQ